MKKIDRFSNYMTFKGLSDNKVATDIGIANGLLGKARNGERDLSAKTLDKILNFYSDINPVWLMTGEGEMLKPSNSSAVKIGNVTANATIQGGVSSSDAVGAESLRKENEALRREMDDLRRERDRLAGANSALTEIIRQLTGKN